LASSWRENVRDVALGGRYRARTYDLILVRDFSINTNPRGHLVAKMRFMGPRVGGVYCARLWLTVWFFGLNLLENVF